MVQLFCDSLPAIFRWWLPKVSAIFGLIWPYEVWDLSELLYLCNCDRMMWSQMSQSTTNIAINHKLHNQPQCHNSYLACHNTHKYPSLDSYQNTNQSRFFTKLMSSPKTNTLRVIWNTWYRRFDFQYTVLSYLLMENEQVTFFYNRPYPIGLSLELTPQRSKTLIGGTKQTL